MKKEKKIPMTSLVERLGVALEYPIGMNHLAVLIHGWTKNHPEQAPTYATLRIRKHRDGFAWLKADEVQNLSKYAGYKLM